ncbi:hypothetical protein, partial [Acetobacter cerevisiae]
MAQELPQSEALPVRDDRRRDGAQEIAPRPDDHQRKRRFQPRHRSCPRVDLSRLVADAETLSCGLWSPSAEVHHLQAYDRYNETDNKKSEQPDAEKNSSIDAQSSSELNSQNKKSGQSPSGVTSGVFPDENAHFSMHVSDDPLLSFTDPDPQVRQQAQHQQDEYNRAASELRQIDPGNQILNYWSDGTTAPTLERIQAVNTAIQTAKSNQDWNNINSTIYGNNSSGMNVVILHSGSEQKSSFVGSAESGIPTGAIEMKSMGAMVNAPEGFKVYQAKNGDKYYESPEGLIYGPGSKDGDRRGNLTEGLYIGLDYEKVCFVE